MAPTVKQEVSTREGRDTRGAVRKQTMKAITYDKYGSFDVLVYRDIAMPAVKEHEVLVHVHAAAVHVGDCYSVKGAPFAMRLVTGLLKPKYGIPGFDLAGQVEAVGESVTQFRPGDEVFGASNGTCAEYARAGEMKLALKRHTLAEGQRQ